MKKRNLKPGRRTTTLPWRFQTSHDGGFDELVLGDFLHVEMNNDRSGYLVLFNRQFWFAVDKDGKSFLVDEEVHEPVPNESVAEDK